MQNALQLIELGSKAREFLSLDVAEHQRGLVATMAESYADALFPPDDELGEAKPWLRGVTRDGTPAGFIMCADPTQGQKDAWIWRLLVDKHHQGFGVGTFAVKQALGRYLSMGVRRVLVSWEPQGNSPAGFYQKLGFKETGDIADGEVVAEIDLWSDTVLAPTP
jgi:diamine N-acetyltransferase